jgi:pimeloyl-ACP methyl ester carboxylesterase
MIIETFGNKNDKNILLIHGMAMEGQNYHRFEKLLPDCHLIIPTLDGHHAENKTPFVSLSDQVDKIIAFLNENGIDELFCVAGTSLGALMAFELFKRRNPKVKKFIFDGGPFFEMNFFQECIFEFICRFVFFLLKITKGKLLYPRSLLPIKQSVVDFSTFTTREDLRNIAHTIFNLEIPIPFDGEGAELIFLYGSKENALRSMKRFRGVAGYRLIRKDKLRHCQFVTNFPEEFAELIL